MTQWQTADQIAGKAKTQSSSQYDKTIQQMDGLMTADNRINEIIKKDPSQWTPMEIAISKLNPSVAAMNKKYQELRNKAMVIQNEQANIESAYQFMLNAYDKSERQVKQSADAQMNANSAQANVQASGAISGLAGLAGNPTAAAQTRLTAQNQAAIQNTQVAAQRDNTLANIQQAKAQSAK